MLIVGVSSVVNPYFTLEAPAALTEGAALDILPLAVNLLLPPAVLIVDIEIGIARF